jgi:hypothetical protein
MKKRVAVLGCSTSSLDQVRVYSTDNRDWVHLISNQNTDYQFDNYATAAHGTLYYDYVLKHILADMPEGYYDTLIIQFTILGRWFHPIQGLGPNLDDPNGIFADEWVTDDYCFKRLNNKRVVSTRGGSHVYAVDRVTDHIHEECVRLENVIKKYHQPDSIATSYEKNFTKIFKNLYAGFFNNVFCWDFACNHGYGQFGTDDDFEYRNDIGHSLPFQSWAIEKYGLEHYAKHMLDDSMHCTKLGNEVLAYEYLADSRLGQHFGLGVNAAR